MKIYTDEFDPAGKPQSLVRQVYNGFDTCLTSEIFSALQPLRVPENFQGNLSNANLIYNFERALQAPVLEMMQRGFAVDQLARAKGGMKLRKQIDFLENQLNQFAFAVWQRPLNANSPKQLIDFFYHSMRLPEQYKFDKGTKRLSTDREALEHLYVYFYARPIVSTILSIRDLKKKLSVLETEIDPDGRFRASFSIAGTETGRFSSSANAFGTAGNIQNITAELRHIFVPDPGYKLCGIDLEQAESREVGWQCGILFDEWGYLEAAYGGDLHTLTCRLIWPDLPWTGDPKRDKEIAETPFYRQYSHRDMSKRGGHGSNYYGTSRTMAMHLKVPTKLMETFQEKYFEAFPGIPRWHRHVAQQLQQHAKLITPFGRERTFFGRLNDDATLRESIAFVPQSSTADRTNLILLRLWTHMRDRIQLIAQVHDAIYFQFKETLDEKEIIDEALLYFDIEMEHKGHKLIVPGEPKTGWNWGNFSEANPNGLKKFKGKDERKRLGSLEKIL